MLKLGQAIQLSFGYLQGWRLHRFSGQTLPPLKKSCEILFPYIELAIPFLQLGSVAPCLLSVHVWKGPNTTFLTSPTRLVLSSPKALSSQAGHVKLPQLLLVHGVPQSPAIPVAPQAFSTILQPCCEQWPTHSQHWITGRFRMGVMGAGVGPALSSTTAEFTDVAAAFGGIRLTKFEKPYSRVETSKICPHPATSCSCSKPPCLHMHAWTQDAGSSYLKVSVACVLLRGSLFIAPWCSQHWPLCTARWSCNLALAQDSVTGRQRVSWLCFEKWPRGSWEQ